MANPAPIPPQPASGTTTEAADPAAPANKTAASVKPLDGSTTIDDKVFLECEILAQEAVSKISQRIAHEIHELASEQRPATIILVDATIASALQMLAALELQLAFFEKSFAAVAPAGQPTAGNVTRLAAVPGLGIGAVTGAVQGVLDLLGLFRQDTQFNGRSVNIKDQALFLEIAHFLRVKKFQVLHPRLLSYQASEAIQLSESTLGKLFDGVFTARSAAVSRFRPQLARVSGIEQQILDRERDFPAADPARQKILTAEIQDLKNQLIDARKNLDPDLVLFDNTDTQWNELTKGLNAPDAKTGQVPIQLINRAVEAVCRFKTAESTACFLYAEAIVAGGTTRIRRNLWRTLFVGDGLTFSGGAIVAYALFDGNARIVLSRTHRFMTDFEGFPSAPKPSFHFNSFDGWGH